ncbi:MAG: hypothetical protein HLUCCX10_03315 [Algoriphagus marincola HL-49]|uniref:Uncharacterized protein n=1 Tax=Algoriphagus marincola HL-49 TaxID=1305737 RepID=A0A0P8C8S2_9BACT|nr:MAG: hypothetical protein HLUCCX10_03315 [Algoriphagus marincola HL-49]
MIPNNKLIYQTKGLLVLISFSFLSTENQYFIQLIVIYPMPSYIDKECGLHKDRRSTFLP